MDIYYFALIILIGLAVSDLIVGVSNDAVNFLNASIGSRVAPRHVIMIIASLGMLVGVTFSSGMMEVARKGIFHPRFFMMPELITIFLAVMLTDILLLDLFNTFGLPTSTTVSIVFELLGAAVAVSLIKIYDSGYSYAMLVNYINTGKAFAITMGILLSVVLAFFFGVVVQFISRLVFTFDYQKRLKRWGGIWGGIALAVITYFILIKGAKGTSFLTPEAVAWIKTHTLLIFSVNFLFFALFLQLLMMFTRINIFKPIVLAGTFALAMAFAANDLVNFIGVPLAGLSAYNVATATQNPLTVTMEALQKPIQSSTYLLLIAGVIMVVTLWFSRKSRTVTKTELTLGRQDEGIERFGSSALSRIIISMVYPLYGFINRCIPIPLKRTIAGRLDPDAYVSNPTKDGQTPSFDLLRASVNLMVASAVVSFATSLKLPLSTTYVTFMVAMGTSLSDQAWGRESAVYRITGVLTVIGGWFFTAFVAFSVSFIFAFILHFFKLPAIVGLVVLAFIFIVHSYRWHFKKEKENKTIEAFSLKDVTEPDTAILTTFEQTGLFLKEISDTLGTCFEAAFLEDRQRLKNTKAETEKIQKWADVIVANIFKTLFLLHREDISSTQQYSHTIRSLQSIVESHNDIIMRVHEHFENYHIGFIDPQKEELRKIKIHVTRLLWNTSIMLLWRKKVDYDYIANQCLRLNELVNEFDKNQIKRIQNADSKTRLSILFYGILENSLKIAEQTRNLLEIFRESFEVERQ
ncbi:MAG: inorganic phosphate transporter [Deltaproteobacteria bacterium]|nr:inorganic phosphate transporter [Deltaproteobacteria bacterium]